MAPSPENIKLDLIMGMEPPKSPVIVVIVVPPSAKQVVSNAVTLLPERCPTWTVGGLLNVNGYTDCCLLPELEVIGETELKCTTHK